MEQSSASSASTAQGHRSKPGGVEEERRAGFTLSELITVLALAAIMIGIATIQFSTYLERAVPDRASRIVGTYVSLTRSYAVQRRSAVTLAVNPVDLTLMIRSEEDTIRTLDFGEDSDLPLVTLDTNIDGDSLTFNARGVCSVCGLVGNGITVAGSNTSYFITFTSMGRWKRTEQ
jgi:prepilin-type N-terminal cleavage/methylation domain-containing protein